MPIFYIIYVLHFTNSCVFILIGKYYLVDAGYPQLKGFLGPYKGERYHLPQFRMGRRPMGSKEVFNQAHSSLQSVIERTFGVWKKKWKILRDMPNYAFKKQVKIVIATMALHNYIRMHDQRDRHFQELEANLDVFAYEEQQLEDNVEEDEASLSQEMVEVRDQIATSLMTTA